MKWEGLTMGAERLLKHFDRTSEAPEAVARLRRFILDLAVRGKLVEQDPSDEPAAELLRRIEAEKVKRIKEGQFKKNVPLSRVSAKEAWFDIPASWHWVRLGMITQVLMGQSPPGDTYNKSGDGVPLINGPVEFTDGPFGKTVINQYTTAPTNMCEEGDLLLCVRGSTTGRTNIAGFHACIGRGVAAIRPFFADKYVHLFIWRLRSDIIAMGRGIAFPSISRQQIEELPVPFPPLAEQHRIVAKVDELMTLCYQLQAAQDERERRRDRLVAASLHRIGASANSSPLPPGEGLGVRANPAKSSALTPALSPREREKKQGAAPVAGESMPAWPEAARFHLDHLPRLTTRPEHIKHLRQTILNLAVRGRLVPQDPNDEPATELLKRIQAEKTRVKNDPRKKDPALPDLDLEQQGPFDLPTGWAWVRFPEIGAFGRGKSKHRPRNDSILFEGGTHLLIQTGDVARSQGAIQTYSNKYNDIGLAQSMKWPAGTLCITIAANIADSGILSFDACFPDSVVGFVPVSMFKNARYFEYFMRTAKANLLEFAPATAQKNINLEILRAVLIPLPPLAEQNRIVAKVDELLALCDQLETQLTTTETDSRRLLEAVLRDALAPALEDAAGKNLTGQH